MLKPQRVAIVGATFVLLLQAAALSAGPLLVKYGIDHGISKGDAGALNLAVVVYLGLAVAGLLLGRLAIIYVARIGESFLRTMRNRLFSHVMSLSLDYFETEKTGRIVARMTSDIDAMQELISQGLVLFVQNIFLFIGGHVDARALVAAHSACWWSCRRCSCEPLVPARVQQAYLEVRDSISTNSRRSGAPRCVVQATGARDRSPSALRAPTKTSTKRTWSPPASPRSTSRSWSTPVSRRPR
jgi:ATP-binding cassette subfamily B protein